MMTMSTFSGTKKIIKKKKKNNFRELKKLQKNSKRNKNKAYLLDRKINKIMHKLRQSNLKE